MPDSQMTNNVPWWNKMIMYWHENQISISFHAPDTLPTDVSAPAQFRHDVEDLIASLNIDNLNAFLNMRGYNLKPFSLEKDLPVSIHSASTALPHATADARDERGCGFFETVYHALEQTQGPLAQHFDVLKTEDHHPASTMQNGTMHGSNGKMSNGLQSLHGKFLFPASSYGTVVIGCFNVERIKTPYSMPGMAGMNGGNSDYPSDMSSQVIDLINTNLDKLTQNGNVPIVAAMPNWLSGGTPIGMGGCGGHGCPVVPPIPVPHANPAYPLQLPELPALTAEKGEGVTVFVLDTLPTLQQIINASQAANPSGSPAAGNTLLQKFVEQIDSQHGPSIKLDHRRLPPILEEDGPDQPVTGRDIYGRLVGFDMPDHGLFIAGMIRDLAPAANIECIRVLNDRAIGNTATLISALQQILVRMLWGDLRDRAVVINLSLVMTPAQEELALVWMGDGNSCQSDAFASMMRNIELLRASLHRIIQSLVSLGAVIVAAAGNDSNVHQWNAPAMYGMNMSPRWGPRYPAAFPEVISVGAVDKTGKAAPYSNYPDLDPNHNGIAAYGGAVPTPVPPAPGECMTHAKDIEGIVGIYSAPTYPALSGDDCESDYAAPPDSHGWATWVGTSFAVPIVTALATRVLEKVKGGSLPPYLWSAEVQHALTTTAGQQRTLGKALAIQPEFGTALLMITQPDNVPETELVHAASGLAAQKPVGRM